MSMIKQVLLLGFDVHLTYGYGEHDGLESRTTNS
jgi:hypothetical protein